MAYEQHITSASEISARCAVLTLSDTRTATTDTSGQLIQSLLAREGHRVVSYAIVRDEPERLAPLLDDLIMDDGIDAVLLNGGTGIARRDVTVPVIGDRLEVALPGFGELFRMLSYEQIGSGAMLSRAVGGISRQTVIFSMPGSTKAVELAMTKLILPELRHLLFELRKE